MSLFVTCRMIFLHFKSFQSNDLNGTYLYISKYNYVDDVKLCTITSMILRS